MTSASAINGAIQRKIHGIGVVRARKGISLVILNEDMDDFSRIIKSLGNSSKLIDGVSETVKHEIERQESGFLGMLLETLGASMLRNILTGKCVLKARRGCNNMDHMDNFFCSAPSFKKYRDYKVFQLQS